MEEGQLALLATLFAFGAISVALYLFVLRPIVPNNENAAVRTASGAAAGHNNNQPLMNRPRNDDAGQAAAAANNRSSSSGNIEKFLAKCATFPKHIAESSQKNRGASMISTDGLLAFRYTQAASIEQQSKSPTDGVDVASQNRRERARILAKMLSLSDAGAADDAKSFARGSTFVISIPLEECSCPKLRRVLYLLSTYYNVLVILVVPPSMAVNDLETQKAKLRGEEGDTYRLDTAVLPSHRIIAASSATGRIAFVRQLSRVEIVLDFDNEVKSQLSRFGYKVITAKKLGYALDASG